MKNEKKRKTKNSKCRFLIEWFLVSLLFYWSRDYKTTHCFAKETCHVNFLVLVVVVVVDVFRLKV
jgi:hypothetical protein